jgi:Kef-type K+ transport system membrane component KefB
VSPPDVVAHVFATLAAVIALGTIMGRLCRVLGQPAVIGEIAAGIVLGPSFLGAFWPEFTDTFVPSAATDPQGFVPSALRVVAQLGVVLYLFLVGLGLNPAALRKSAGIATAVSVASIALPFALGFLLSLWLHPMLAPEGVAFLPFALFVAAALSVTAFPVLARILADQGLAKTPLGVLGLSCAAADDLIAWCLLAFVVGASKAEFGGAVATISGAAAFVGVMAFVVRPLASRLCQWLDARPGPLPAVALPLTLVAVLLAGLTTELIGVHAIFGAFLMGTMIPHESRLAHVLTAKLSAAVQGLLLPAFFALSGLKTDLRLLSSPADWLVIVVIVGVATLGKFGGTLVAARFTGLGWRPAAALGAMMNTRGLMALIVLDIGLRSGVLSPRLYAMTVVAALIMTVATAPALRLFADRPRPDARQESGEP